MALEAELRARVEQSVKDLDQVVRSLHEVKRLADSNQASTKQLTKLTTSMDSASGQIQALLQSIEQAGAVLVTGAATLKAADPGPAISEAKAVILESKAESAALRHSMTSLDQRVDALMKLLEGMPSMTLETNRSCKDLLARIDALTKTSVEANDKLEKDFGAHMATLENRIGPLTLAAWLAAIFGGISALIVALTKFG